MKTKSSLGRYRQYKTNRGTIEHTYDNARKSTPLAGARAGFLNTDSFRARFEGGDGRCSICNHHTEDLEHVIMECTDGQGMDTEIQRRLGLHEDSTSAIVERTKGILERWERSTKDHVPEAPRSKY